MSLKIEMSRVYIERFERPESCVRKLPEALKWLGMNEIIAPGALVFIKPNVTWRIPTPGVTGYPGLSAGLDRLLSFTPNITV